MTDVFESFLNHQAESTTKFILKDPTHIAVGLEKKYVRGMSNTRASNFAPSDLSKVSTKKSTKMQYGIRHESTKSPLDIHELTKIKNDETEERDIGKFNQSSSQNIDVGNINNLDDYIDKIEIQKKK